MFVLWANAVNQSLDFIQFSLAGLAWLNTAGVCLYMPVKYGPHSNFLSGCLKDAPAILKAAFITVKAWGKKQWVSALKTQSAGT